MKSLLREFTALVLNEAKIDVIKQRFPQFAATLDRVNRIHPKYLEWSAKQLTAGAKEQDLLPTLRVFNTRSSSFDKRDINAYPTLADLEDTVKSLKPSRRAEKSVAKADGAEKIFESDEYVILHIKNKDASVCYGAGTKWCITMTDARYFEQYTGAGVIFYFVINKSLPPDDPMSKVAFAIYRKHNGDRFEITQYEVFDALDNSIKSIESPYTKFLEIIRDDAVTRPENPQIALARAAEPKVYDGTATEEEARAFVETLDDDRLGEFLQEIEDSTLRQWSVNVYRALVDAQSNDAVEKGMDGLAHYREYELMRAKFVKNRWTHQKQRLLYKFPKTMMMTLLRDELSVDAPNAEVIRSLVRNMKNEELVDIFNNMSGVAQNAAEDEIVRRDAFEAQKKNKKPYSPWGV